MSNLNLQGDLKGGIAAEILSVARAARNGNDNAVSDWVWTGRHAKFSTVRVSAVVVVDSKRAARNKRPVSWVHK